MNNIIKRVVLFIFLFSFLVGAGSSAPVEAARNFGGCSLQFIATPSTDTIQLGGEVVYQYALKNIGSSACAGVGVSLYYAENEKYVSSSPSPTASDYYWSIGNLNRGKTFSFSVVIKNSLGGEQMFGEGCASADGADDACVSNPVNLLSNLIVDNPMLPEFDSTPTVVDEELPVVDPILPVVDPVTSEPISTNIQAWVYPGQPSCSATNEYSEDRRIDTLKPEYYTVQSTGELRQLTVAADGCNAYSVSNVADIKAHSKKQFVTVSGNIANVRKLLSSAILQTVAIKTLTDFTVSTEFTGVEIDWEGFSDWSATDYANYKKFITDLQNSLRAKGKFLIIDAPAISDAKYQSYFLFKYEDFVHVDYIAIMAYDYQYDYGVGEPIAPEAWVGKVINWAKARLDTNQIIIGIANYGYHGPIGSYNVTIDTRDQSSTYNGFANRKLNDEGEEVWTSGGNYYAVQTVAALDDRKAFIESLGIKSVSVWHLGGNPWFSNL